MSAYVVDREHVVSLVSAAMSRRFNPYGGTFTWFFGQTRELAAGDFDRASAVANMLWEENIRSVLERYPDDTRETMPGPISENFQITPRDFRVMARAPEPVQLLASIACYAYQSCEHDAWIHSEARVFVESLKEAAIRVLPGYDNANWGAAGPKPARA